MVKLFFNYIEGNFIFLFKLFYYSSQNVVLQTHPNKKGESEWGGSRYYFSASEHLPARFLPL